MSVVKQRNKRQKNQYSKMHWKVYNEWMNIRQTLGFDEPLGEFSKRMIREDVKQQVKGKM